MIVGVAAVYFFFGVVAYFFYFGWAPMPPTLYATRFIGECFSETESSVIYEVQSSMSRFEKLHKERSPFPRIYYWLAMGNCALLPDSQQAAIAGIWRQRRAVRDCPVRHADVVMADQFAGPPLSVDGRLAERA
jgi:hypothetical protein